MTNIYFDSDFLISFLCFNDDYFDIVDSVCVGKNFVVPKEVLTELERKEDIVLSRVNNMIEKGKLSLYTMDTSEPSATIKYLVQQRRKGCKQMGAGEAAAIALASVHSGILASNNMRDIAKYVQLQSIKHITSSRVIAKAYKDGLILDKNARAFWENQITRGNKMPDPTFEEFYKRKEKWPID